MKLLVSDYDGTLFTDERNMKINVKRIEEFVKEGNLFMLSSGRSFESLMGKVEEHNIPISYLATEDGSHLFDKKGTLLHEELLDLDIEDESISIGEIQKVLFNIINAIVAIGQMAPNIQVIKASCSASSDYFSLYERKPKIYESEKNLTPDRNSIKGSIEFKNIKFIYPSDKAQRPILNGLNMEIEAGKKVAFVGESGCGKSTTVNLIERLYDPVEGQILIDGIDIKEFNLEYLNI